MSSLVTNRRVEARAPVRWGAVCQVGNRSAGGLVRNVSGGGAFLTPATQAETAETAMSAEQLDFLALGDTVVLSIVTDDHAQPVRMHGTVRWIGFSRENEVTGAGVRFDTEWASERLPQKSGADATG